ncbi:MAG TPA: TerC family protein [Methylomirabilota bacterium]|nr:TerC family protein [Methylomirabilota bacterium]
MAPVLSPGFWLGLAQIAYLNLLLSGDNALVIALAVRALPPRKRVQGQIWGAAGAVALRLLFLGVVMYLLEAPFLKLVGGLLLVWIAIKLVQSETGVESEVRRGASLWDAIWIIIVADVTMSLDNVLAVAAAAHGDFLLIVLGIALSLPIVVWGAGWLARLMNRYTWIVWLGGGVLGKVAGQMLLEDRLVRGWPWTHGPEYDLPGGIAISLHPLPLTLGALIVVLGWWLGRRRHAAVPENV